MDYMAQALSLAKLALGEVSPNPAVGAVLVRSGTIVGQGYTQPPGSYHAEISALQQAGDNGRGSVMYVTMEPCCHYGKTPPCTRAIVEAGVAEVHMAMIDPNPLVSGRGRDELEREGIRIQVGEHEEEARELNETYIKYITTGLPFVTAKFAMSLDGKIATARGDSKWISGDESRKYVHALRHISDAIMVGVNTVIADDPKLTARCCGGRGGTARKQPLRVIVDGKGHIPQGARVFNEPGTTFIVLDRNLPHEKRTALRKSGAELIEVSSDGETADLSEVMKELGRREITSILAEGGGILLGSLFDAGLVDKVVAFIAPIIIGGKEAKIPVGGRGVESIAESIRLERVKIEKYGDDVMVSGYIRR